LKKADEFMIVPERSSQLPGPKKDSLFKAFASWGFHRVRVVLIFLVILLTGSLAYNRSQASPSLLLDDIPLLPLDAVSRLLILAPHPDDETLAAGGVIQKAVDAGIKVRVVILTNGDGQVLAPLALRMDLLPRTKDYIARGEQRRTETLNSLGILGISSKDITFLGYPDGQLNQLWVDNWNQACPLRARLTKSTHNPYPQNGDLEKSYCGKNLVDELQTIIEEYKPDLIVMPHPNDTHSDHRAATNFILMALAQERVFSPDYKPSLMGYLVHYGYYPQTRGWHLTSSILPPVALSGTGNQWFRIDLSQEQVNRKAQAIRAFPSQMRLLGSFLPSFTRSDEIFSSLEILDISPLAFNSLTLSEEGIIQAPSLSEPIEESARKVIIGGADLVGLKVVRIGYYLWLTAETRSPLLPGLRYRFQLKLSNGITKIVTWPGSAIRTGSSTYSLQVNLEEIKDVIALGFAADVQQGVTLDRTGWRFLVLRDRVP
jgi:LmbE family N-acetylglucosaminyl deacetylase